MYTLFAFFLVLTIVIFGMSAAIFQGTMNIIYFAAMLISFLAYLIAAFVVRLNDRELNAKEYFIAGHDASSSLIAGSLVASYFSTGVFMANASVFYSGLFCVAVFICLQSAGYYIGAAFFGRYLHRSGTLTIPEFFGKRFNSQRMRSFSAIIAIIMMSVYLLSIVQGVGVLMSTVSGISYAWCIIISLIAVTLVTVIAGSRGVLVTDTIMASVLVSSIIFMAIALFGKTGGVEGIRTLVTNFDTVGHFSWGGKTGVVAESKFGNILYGLNLGIVWAAICATAPWQSSKFMMAKNETDIMKSALIAGVALFVVESLTAFSATLTNIGNSSMSDSSTVLIWASNNMVPVFIGIFMIVGMLAAGISSATTFLSLVAASFANDIFTHETAEQEQKNVLLAQIATVIVSGVVLAAALAQPPTLFWTMVFGAGLAASSWMPVAIVCVVSKKLSEQAAIFGMFAGFLACFGLNIAANVNGTKYLIDPNIVGIVCNFAAMFLVTKFGGAATEEEQAAREQLLKMPEQEKDPVAKRRTLNFAKAAVFSGGFAFIYLNIIWVLPYARATAFYHGFAETLEALFVGGCISLAAYVAYRKLKKDYEE